MKRKLIKQGTSSLTISLPTSWTKKYSLKGGDEIFLEESEKSIILSAKQSFIAKKSKVDISGLRKTFIWVYLNNLYIRGDDEIEVRFTSKAELDTALKSADNFIGFTVVEQGKNYCILKDISGTSEDSFDALLRRIFLLTIMMAEDGYLALEKSDIETITELQRRDEQINKLISFCLRTLNKKGHSEFNKTGIYITIINLLEHIGDEYARCFREIKEPVSKNTMIVFQKTVSLNKDFYKLFYNFDQKLASKMLDERNDLRNEIDILLTKAKTCDIPVLYRSKKIIELIIDIVKIQIGMHI